MREKLGKQPVVVGRSNPDDPIVCNENRLQISLHNWFWLCTEQLSTLLLVSWCWLWLVTECFVTCYVFYVSSLWHGNLNTPSLARSAESAEQIGQRWNGRGETGRCLSRMLSWDRCAHHHAIAAPPKTSWDVDLWATISHHQPVWSTD